MRILYFTKSKKYTIKALERMIKDGHQVDVVFKSPESAKDSQMSEICRQNGIQQYFHDEIYCDGFFEKNKYDLGISNTFGKRIKKEAIQMLKGRIFNIHCAPLPEYKGMYMYNWGIYYQENEWKVTAHYVNEYLDDGKIIDTKEFSIDQKTITVGELEETSQKKAYELTFETISKFFDGNMPAGIPQTGNGHYYSRSDFEELKKIETDYSCEEIIRRIRACYCPGYEGAYFVKDGYKFPINAEEFFNQESILETIEDEINDR